MVLRNRTKHTRASSILVVTFMILLVTIAGLAFMNRSTIFMRLTGLHNDHLDANYKMEAAYETARGKITRAMSALILDGKLHFVSGAPATETFADIADTYGQSAETASTFLSDILKSRAFSAAGVEDTTYEFDDFSHAFPTEFTDPDPSDDEYFEVKYTFTPMVPNDQTASNPRTITFDYEYRVQMRGYGSNHFTALNSEDNGVISIEITEAPFSAWAAFMDSMLNQNGNIVVFAGGNDSSRIQDIFTGPVHVNGLPYFYGHPNFTTTAPFTSATDSTSWVNFSDANYTAGPTFSGGSQGAESGISSISMPSTIYNTARLAAGDPSSTASTDNTAITTPALVGFLTEYAGGTLAGNTVPEGIYVPIDDQSSLIPTGGVYVKGDARIQMNVVQGQSDFNATQWAQINSGDQSCKWQKISVTHLTSGITNRDIYIGSDPCSVTYVFDTTNTGNTPAVLGGRLNGVIHVDGKIDELGGASRTRAAVAQDFAMTISATKDIRVINDIQYEDAVYKVVQSDGTLGSTTVATPTGEYDSSGYANTATDVGATIDSESQTVLGIISTQRNVLLHVDAPADINLHAAIFAGNSAQYSSGTGYGCGANTDSQRGCGFGYEGWSSQTGKGNLKLLGAIAEFKDQTLGQAASPSKGYGSRYYYDTRLRQSIIPPGFPTSGQPLLRGYIRPYRTWRISQN